MRNWLIAMAVGGTLTGLSHTASAQAIKRTGGGFAKSECFVSAGSCGGIGPATCPGPDCNTFVSGNGTNFVGVNGESRISMSGANINVSGSASFTPPSSCSPGQQGDPVYTADGNQSIYADVPNGTPIRITITASVSGSGGGWATWSDAKSGSGGTSATTVFNALAGPGKITADGIDYYLIDSIRANGAAVSRRICSANKQSFSASVSIQFEVLGTNLMKVRGDGSGPVGSRLPNPLTVRVLDTATGEFVNGVDINFERDNAEPCAEGFSANPNFTATIGKGIAKGIARSYVNLPQQPGKCLYKATCASCLGNRKVTFKVEATPLPTLDISGDESGGKQSGGGPSPSGGKGDDSPLRIEYGRFGKFVLTSPPDPPNGFVGVLMGDQAQFRASPSGGTLNWYRDGSAFASGPEVSATFNQERLIDNSILFEVRRTEDGKTESVLALVEQRPTGIGDEDMKVEIIRTLIKDEGPFVGGAKAALMGYIESASKDWARRHFEPAGRSLTERQGRSCRSNCCDAGKHAFGQAVVTKLVGISYAQSYGIAHEVTGLADSSSNETVMDLHNNRLGQAVGKTTSAITPEGIGNDVLPRIRSGDALVLFNPWDHDKNSLLEKSTRCAQ